MDEGNNPEHPIPVTDPQAASARSNLEKRCAAADITITEEDDPIDGGKFLLVHLPDGRAKRPYPLWNLDYLEKLLAIPFERYVYLSPYEAICSYSSAEIESLVISVDRIPMQRLRRRLLGRPIQEDQDEEPLNFHIRTPDGKEELSLNPPSDAMRVLLRRAGLAPFSLKIKGLHVGTHDAAVGALTKLSNSLFFQMELMLGLTLNLRLSGHRKLSCQGEFFVMLFFILSPSIRHYNP